MLELFIEKYCSSLYLSQKYLHVCKVCGIIEINMFDVLGGARACACVQSSWVLLLIVEINTSTEDPLNLFTHQFTDV